MRSSVSESLRTLITPSAPIDGGRFNAVWKIITGDETWLYNFDPETKQQSAQLKPIGGALSQNFRREHSVAKKMVVMFMVKTGHVATVPHVWQSTVSRG
ncbi:unnamed protein product [Echinostoma caproni]|uniref:Transposase n=1 Tax=Echinostoma caproni TaxID=27848 RepID=A0A183ACX4_9TREM|nr:unnamed protein product [Echinostoma caproni]